MLACILVGLACVRFEGLPDMLPGTASDPAVYASSAATYNANVASGRLLARKSNISWTLVGTEGERFATALEIRRRFAGVIFVGDSQIREVAWSALQLLTAGRETLAFSAKDKVFGKNRPPHRSACVPQTVGKTGFTASCDGSATCELYSPFHNKSHAEHMRKLLLTRPHSWDGKLSVSKSVCGSDFFVSYQATWGAMPIKPDTVPACLHPAADDPSGKFGLRLMSGQVKPVLWIIDGCGLHEMEFCDPRRDELPQNAFAHFSAALLRSGTVVYQPVGAGFLMAAARRFKGACASINADQIAAKERAWLDSHSVPYYDYTKLALQYAPLMFDAIHFTYYWVPCSQTFPEMARLVAQLGFQQAVGRPTTVCAPGTPPGPVAVASPTDAAEEGVTRLHLGQDTSAATQAYAAAIAQAGKQAAKSAALEAKKVAAQAKKAALEAKKVAVEAKKAAKKQSGV